MRERGRERESIGEGKGVEHEREERVQVFVFLQKVFQFLPLAQFHLSKEQSFLYFFFSPLSLQFIAGF